MGFLNHIRYGKAAVMPSFQPTDSVLPAKAVNLIESGTLPELNVHTLLLNKGEVCRFVDKSYLIQVQVIKRSQRKNQGVSFRVTKRVTYHTGSSYQEPIEEHKTNYVPGYLYITNKGFVCV